MYNYSALRTNAIDGMNALMTKWEPMPRPQDRVRLVEQAVLKFHMIGVAGLLLDASPTKFTLNLLRAGQNRAEILEYCLANPTASIATSKLQALWGTIAAGDERITNRIAQASLGLPRVEREYEDEYRFARLVCTHLIHGLGDRSAVVAAATDLESAGTDIFIDRIPVLMSILDGETADFVDGLRSVERRHEEKIEDAARSASTPHSAFAPYRYVWLEGLAWLRLAEHSGMDTDDDFLYCPRMARIQTEVGYAGDWTLPIQDTA